VPAVWTAARGLAAGDRPPRVAAAARASQVIEMTQVTAASDIWSVGCLILELLTGYPPYYDLQPMSALFRIVQVGAEVAASGGGRARPLEACRLRQGWGDAWRRSSVSGWVLAAPADAGPRAAADGGPLRRTTTRRCQTASPRCWTTSCCNASRRRARSLGCLRRRGL
jgi:hypothetical protein